MRETMNEQKMNRCVDFRQNLIQQSYDKVFVQRLHVQLSPFSSQSRSRSLPWNPSLLDFPFFPFSPAIPSVFPLFHPVPHGPMPLQCQTEPCPAGSFLAEPFVICCLALKDLPSRFCVWNMWKRVLLFMCSDFSVKEQNLLFCLLLLCVMQMPRSSAQHDGLVFQMLPPRMGWVLKASAPFGLHSHDTQTINNHWQATNIDNNDGIFSSEIRQTPKVCEKFILTPPPPQIANRRRRHRRNRSHIISLMALNFRGFFIWFDYISSFLFRWLKLFDGCSSIDNWNTIFLFVGSDKRGEALKSRLP